MSEKNPRLWMTVSGHCYDDSEYEAFAEVFPDDVAVFDYLAGRGFVGLVWRPLSCYAIILPEEAKRTDGEYTSIRPHLCAAYLRHLGASEGEADALVARYPHTRLTELKARFELTDEYYDAARV